MKTKRFIISSAILSVLSLFFVDLSYGYPGVSPYVFVLNNPMQYYDPDGMRISTVSSKMIVSKDKNGNVYGERVYYWEDGDDGWGFYGSVTGNKYTGGSTFIDMLAKEMRWLMSRTNGFILIHTLMDDPRTVNIQQTDNKSGWWGFGNNTIEWNPTGIRSNGVKEHVATNRGLNLNPGMNLGHELGHVYYDWSGGMREPWYYNGGKEIPTSEIGAIFIENLMRGEQGLGIRTHYLWEGDHGAGPALVIPSSFNDGTYWDVYYNAARESMKYPSKNSAPAVMPYVHRPNTSNVMRNIYGR